MTGSPRDSSGSFSLAARNTGGNVKYGSNSRRWINNTVEIGDLIGVLLPFSVGQIDRTELDKAGKSWLKSPAES